MLVNINLQVDYRTEFVPTEKVLTSTMYVKISAVRQLDLTNDPVRFICSAAAI